jgi:Tol biopolymer transport system component
MEIYIMNSDGSGKTRVSFAGDNTGWNLQPNWSPDGSKIVYSHGGNLWVVNADGTNEVSLSVSGVHPAWSPDGNKIAYHNGGGTPGGQLWMMNVDGTNQERVDPFTDPSSSGNSVQDMRLGWSPDGTKIAFQSYADQAKASILTLADRSIVTVTGLCPSCQNSSTSFLSWSPDGSKILVRCNSQEGRSRICVMDSDGNNTTMIPTPNLPVAALRDYGPHISGASWSN